MPVSDVSQPRPGSGCIESAAACLRRQLNVTAARRPFHTAVVLGSGLGCTADAAVAAGGRAVDYGEIPGMPVPAVAGHAGRIVAGTAGLQQVLLLQGRVHSYEGHSAHDVVFAVRMLQQLGIQRLILTNAAGGIRADFCPGDLMLIQGHLDLFGGANVWAADSTSFGESPCYNAGPFTSRQPAATRRGLRVWNQHLLDCAQQQPTNIRVHRGIYAWMPGPNYETPAEVRMLRTLGADAVGMSTVPEALCAAAAGVQVLGISCITNVAAGLGDHPLSHEEVDTTARSIQHSFSDWLLQVIRNCPPPAQTAGP